MKQEKPKIRLYVPDAFAAGQGVMLTPGQAHYLWNVMRCRENDPIAIFNGTQGEWLAHVAAIEKKSVTLICQGERVKQKNSPDVWLAFAPIKNKTELVVEKAVELGVSALLPVFTRHAVVRSVNMEKLTAHAIEAAEQSERHDVPRIEEHKDLSTLLGAWPKDRTLLYGDESGGGEALKTLLPQLPQGKYAILIGPEGGFSSEEQQMLKAASFVKGFGMGPRILRADTAAVAALACLQAWRGDWEERPGVRGFLMDIILDTLKTLDETRRDDIERWFVTQREKAAPFFYTSVDLRHSGSRLIPVDTNLYPAGFNNISPAGQARASRFAKRFFSERYPQAKRVLVVPENHTRNLGYLENLATLLAILERTGVEVQLGSLAATDAPIELQSPSGRALIEQPIMRDGEHVVLANGFRPDVIVMNNDMTGGAPEILRQQVQPVVPPIAMGWWQRRKSLHFTEYKALAEEFGKQFNIDPWLISAEFHRCGMVDFKESSGLDCMAKGIEKVLERVRKKYEQYGINEDPYVYVKAESGTYGMGIMTVKAPEEILELNKKSRNKMQVIKEGARVSEVIIQEGVPTIDTVEGKPAEPVVYMIDGVPVGGMYRVNGERDALGNLNAAGMQFTGMCDEVEDECGQWTSVRDCHFRSLGIVAAIAALAAAREDYRVGRDGAGI